MMDGKHEKLQMMMMMMMMMMMILGVMVVHLIVIVMMTITAGWRYYNQAKYLPHLGSAIGVDPLLASCEQPRR